MSGNFEQIGGKLVTTAILDERCRKTAPFFVARAWTCVDGNALQSGTTLPFDPRK
jgi:hypothetical protein